MVVDSYLAIHTVLFYQLPQYSGGTFYTTVFKSLAARAVYHGISQFYTFYITLYGYIVLHYLYHAFCIYILLPVVMYLLVCVHIDGLARNCGSISANALELLRSRARPGKYMLMCGCVCVCVCVFAHLCLCALFIYSRTIANRANVICCTYTRL